MNSRKLFALFVVFALTGSALAAQQNQYKNTGLKARGVDAVQQHTVFVEIIVEENETREQIHEFSAVVGLVKKCKEVQNIFDNAVLWFNDQFLFGDKQNERFNISETNRYNPNRTHEPDNATGGYNSTEGFVERGHDGDPNDQDPDQPKNDPTDPDHRPDEEPKSINESDPPGSVWNQHSERWGGCFIPRGFMHAIGSDDPFGTGATITAEASVNGTERQTETAQVDPVTGNVEVVKQLINLDKACSGCIFEYQSTFFITDPNGHEWMIDKLVYPLSVGENPFIEGQGGNFFAENQGEDEPEPEGTGDDCANDEDDPSTSEDEGPQSGNTPVGNQSDPRDNYPHHDRCEDQEDGNSDPDDAQNHCYDDTSTDEDDSDPEEDAPECDADRSDPETGPLLVEPIYTVRVQVDPTSPTLQGFADEAEWAYRDGTVRKGMPYPDHPDDPNYDRCKADLDSAKPCAIEYNFLLAIDFAAFDNVAPVPQSAQDPATESGARAGFGGEDEIQDDSYIHGEGGNNHADRAEDGNSHRHNAEDQAHISNENGTLVCKQGGNGAADGTDEGPCQPKHKHDAVNLDLFFYDSAPHFVESLPYWDSYGAPPLVNDECSAATGGTAQQNTAVVARAPIVCDVDADDGYHLHDGSQTVRPAE